VECGREQLQEEERKEKTKKEGLTGGFHRQMHDPTF
jgi:hypothetical protein